MKDGLWSWHSGLGSQAEKTSLRRGSNPDGKTGLRGQSPARKGTEVNRGTPGGGWPCSVARKPLKGTPRTLQSQKAD